MAVMLSKLRLSDQSGRELSTALKQSVALSNDPDLQNVDVFVDPSDTTNATVMTRWTSLDAIERFLSANPDGVLSGLDAAASATVESQPTILLHSERPELA